MGFGESAREKLLLFPLPAPDALAEPSPHHPILIWFGEFVELQSEPLEYGYAVDCEGKAGAGCTLPFFETGGYAVGLVAAPRLERAEFTHMPTGFSVNKSFLVFLYCQLFVCRTHQRIELMRMLALMNAIARILDICTSLSA